MKTELFLLHDAVLSGEIEKVKQVDLQTVDINSLDSHGHSPLHWAVFGGYIDIVKYLLEIGSSPNTCSDDGVTPKWRAQDFGLTEIENLLSAYGGVISTDEKFDDISFNIFNNAIGQSLPSEDKKSTVNNKKSIVPFLITTSIIIIAWILILYLAK